MSEPAGKNERAFLVPAEPCVVISDGELVVIATERTCEPIRAWGEQVGPVARTVMVARLRAFADLIEQVGCG